ncbi:MAG: chorismate-binding protein, partial [Undibacterium sp.]|nr:chorismate-binding protein [Undibacterium sp.]
MSRLTYTPAQFLVHDDTMASCFALLDDAYSSAANSRLYTGLLQILRCHDTASWNVMWRAAECALQEGYFAVSLLSYETGAQLQQIEARPEAAVSQILIFEHCALLDSVQVLQFLEQHSLGSATGLRRLRSNLTQEEFSAAIQRILDYIAAGDTYQVNFTYRLYFESYGSVHALYLALRQRQAVPYGALISLPDGGAIVSLSPELFIRHQAGQLYARPMKGTAAATGDDELDRALALALAQDQKNRAENLMIVDLLRNDLGRIAQTGSVKVTTLFEVKRYNSVLQMTSDI